MQSYASNILTGNSSLEVVLDLAASSFFTLTRVFPILSQISLHKSLGCAEVQISMHVCEKSGTREKRLCQQ